MKHWHRCTRWRERFEACPFGGLDDHDEDEDPEGEADEVLRFEAANVPLPVRPPVPSTPVGVREPVVVPAKVSAAADAIAPGVGTPGSIPGLPWPMPDGLDDITRVIEAAVRQVPARWAPSAAELAEMMAKLGMAKGSARSDVITAAAEVEAVSSFSVEAGVGLDDVWPVALIPLLKHLTKARKLARAGVVGRPGRMDPLRPESTFRTGQQQPGISIGRPGSEGARHVVGGTQFPRSPGTGMRVGGIPGFTNMARRLKQLTSLSPIRTVRGGEGL